jgi:uncharacterized protein (TIGR02996 family)
MNTNEALLQAIWNDPDEDTPRLVYADFLEETGDESDIARAKYIRLDIELAKYGPLMDDFDEEVMNREQPQWDELSDQCWKYRQKYSKIWNQKLFGKPSPYYLFETERGFIRQLRFQCEIPIPWIEEVLDQEPVFTLSLLDPLQEGMEALAASPLFSRIRKLKLEPGGRPRNALIHFLRSPYLIHLWSLEFGGYTYFVPFRVVELLANDPKFSGLRHLRFGKMPIGGKAIQILAKSNSLRHLVSIQIKHDSNDSSAKWLANSPIMKTVRRFEFNTDKDSRKRMKDKGFQYLVHSPYLGQLEEVNLSGNKIGDKGFAHFLHGCTWKNLKSFDFSENEVSDNGLRFLAQAPMGRLIQMSARDNPIQGSGLAIFLSSPVGKRIQRLDCRNCQIDNAGLTAIAAMEGPRELRNVRFNNNQFTYQGFKKLMQSPIVSKITQFRLSENRIGDSGAIALAESEYLSNLHELYMGNCQLTDRGLIALANSPHLRKIRHLELDSNHFSAEGIRALTRAKFIRKIFILSLSRCKLTDEVAEEFIASSMTKNGCVLVVYDNRFSDKMIQTLKKRFQHVTC